MGIFKRSIKKKQRKYHTRKEKKVVADQVVLLVMSRGRAFASCRSHYHHLDGARRRRTMERFLFSFPSSSFSTRDAKKAFSSTTTTTETKEESLGKKTKERIRQFPRKWTSPSLVGGSSASRSRGR